MIISKEKNIPENDKCIICKNYITQDDINKKNFEVVVTKRKTKKYAHTSCIERRKNNENKKRH